MSLFRAAGRERRSTKGSAGVFTTRTNVARQTDSLAEIVLLLQELIDAQQQTNELLARAHGLPLD